jgi:hypothetical protein
MKTTDRQTIRSLGPTRICRDVVALKGCGTPVGQIAAPAALPKVEASGQKPEGSYSDLIPGAIQSDTPGTYVVYAVEVLNRDGRGAGISNQVRVPLAHTLPPPEDFRAQVSGKGIALTWKGGSPSAPPPEIHYVYRLYRYAQDSPARILVAEVPVSREQNYSVTDSSFVWEKTYEYRAEAVTIVEGNRSEQVEGEDTSPVKVFADDVFPPAIPAGVQAVFSGPGQKAFIDLIWAPVTDADIAGYNIYRREEGGAPSKINAELIGTPAYRDASVEAGKRYFYSVSAVDLRGNESARSEEASESVP